MTRAIKGVVVAGLKVREVIASADGVRVLIDPENKHTDVNDATWDEVLE
ncbi:MAG TPA: hypothetical protein PLG99_06635 [Kaistiaceae bacterium]|nr:hypothetical protein [Kaistiaceae bacterium]